MKAFLKLGVLVAGALMLPVVLATPVPHWPTKPLRILVAYPPGSAPDVQARLLVEPLSQALGQTVTIENKPGDGGNVGAAALARVEDGQTIGILGNGQLTSAQFLAQQAGFNAAKDFAPIALVASAPLVWVTAYMPHAASPEEFMRRARQRGNALAYGSTGAGSGIQLGMELLKDALTISARHVAFPSAPQIVGALMNDEVQMALLPASVALPLAESKALSAIAVSSAKPTPFAPGVASLEQIGISGLDIEVWNAFVAPASMPAAHRALLSAKIQAILATRDIRRALFLQGWAVKETSAAALGRRIRKDAAIYRDLVVVKGVKLD